ncbi:hypothetical protein AA105894_2837 [Asaia spathodeae NBRC 105894]|nr:hypothetical protein AA105894_2837 [Asaia spathodeae NBRC 105894]
MVEAIDGKTHAGRTFADRGASNRSGSSTIRVAPCLTRVCRFLKRSAADAMRIIEGREDVVCPVVFRQRAIF